MAIFSIDRRTKEIVIREVAGINAFGNALLVVNWKSWRAATRKTVDKQTD